MYTFKKEERLCSKKLLEKLYHSGSSFLLYPFRVIYLEEDISPDSPAQVVITVSKRRFKRAVDRNLIKRRTREAYRLHKENLLYSVLREADVKLLISISYVGKEILEFKIFEKKLTAALSKIAQPYVQKDS